MNKNKRFVSILAGLMAAVMLLTLIAGLKIYHIKTIWK